MQETFHRPDYADFDPPAKFTAIQSIIAKRLKEHPNAICSYSGGSDSDILIDLVEKTRKIFRLAPVAYEFFNTGLEMKATKDHVKETAKKYGVEIKEYRPKKSIVTVARETGIPFLTKITSQRLKEWQRSPDFSLKAVRDEYDAAENKKQKALELQERYPRRKTLLKFVCWINQQLEPGTNSQFYADPYLVDFIDGNPPDFQISAKCCDYCKKQPAHEAQKGFDMVITGERRAEGGIRAVGKSVQTCFAEEISGQFRLRPLYWCSDKDKAWYKERYGIRYSDAYEVYGMKRTGCCGCPINYRAAEDLKLIEPYEPNVVKAAWNVFGKSYEYRRKYNEYKAERRQNSAGQMTLHDCGLEQEKCQKAKEEANT